MTSFTEYDPKTGSISRIVVTDEVFVPKEGFSFIEGAYSVDLFVIIGGTPISVEVQENGINDWVLFRVERNNRLSSSDWTQLPDSPVDQAAWAKYRRELRDLPDITVDPSNPVWPEPPN